MERELNDILPILGIEQDCILSSQGDVTVAYEVVLPELFTLSDSDYEAVHQAWIKAVKVLPKHTVLHKQDWFTESTYKGDFTRADYSFLSHASERFFNERPFLDHHCYLMLTKKPAGRKPSSSLFSTLLKRSVVPSEPLNAQALQDFLGSCGQFAKILTDSGFVVLNRMKEDELLSNQKKAGLVERYFMLLEGKEAMMLKDLSFEHGIQVGAAACQLYTLADAEDLPPLCGARINYDRYSTDKTKFSVGFAAPLGQLLYCNHLYNQYLFIDDASKTLQQLERKRLRLQSLSAYSRENAIARDSVNDFLNEAITQQRLPLKAHFNVLMWTEENERGNELKNGLSAALAQMDAVARQEVVGAPQIFWAGIPGNAADLPMNDTFDTFTEQACCFLNLETAYRSSLSPTGIVSAPYKLESFSKVVE